MTSVIFEPNARTLLGRLVFRDRAVQLAWIFVAAFLLIYFLPAVDAEAKASVTLYIAPVSMLAFVAERMVAAARRVTRRRERLFWLFLAGGFIVFLIIRLGYLVFPTPGVAIALGSDLLYGAAYLLLMLAVDSRVHEAEGAMAHLADRLRWPANSILVLGLLIYFVIVPAVVSPRVYSSFVPSAALFLALDAYLSWRLVGLATASRTTRWTAIYASLAATTIAFLINDLIEAARFARLLSWDWGGPADVVFLLPFVFAILAARVGAEDTEPRYEGAIGVDMARLAPWEQLITIALTVPTIHIAGYLFGSFDPASETARMTVVLGWLLLSGTLAGVQHTLLANRARWLEAERSRTSEALREHEEMLRLVMERQKAEEERRQWKQRFEIAFRSSPDAITISRIRDGGFVEANESFSSITGWTHDETVGRTAVEMGLWLPGERERMVAQLQETGRIRDFGTEIRAKNGGIIDCSIAGELIELDGERCLVAITRDITDKVRYERQREELIEKLEAKNSELERFTYTVSHDLKSPIVTIGGFLNYLEKDAVEGNIDRLRGDIGQIRSATSQMETLLRDLLELSRIGRVANPPEPVPLGGVVDEVCTGLAGSIEARGITIEVAGDLPTVHCDRTRIYQVFQNLIGNAIKFMGSPADPRIVVGSRVAGSEALCYVQDNGIGIEPRFHDRVFGLFERLDTGREGTGIGLAIVQRIMKIHGGRAWVESDGDGAGSTFWLAFPRNE